jgi:hypothetical protein
VVKLRCRTERNEGNPDPAGAQNPRNPARDSNSCRFNEAFDKAWAAELRALASFSWGTRKVNVFVSIRSRELLGPFRVGLSNHFVGFLGGR